MTVREEISILPSYGLFSSPQHHLIHIPLRLLILSPHLPLQKPDKILHIPGQVEIPVVHKLDAQRAFKILDRKHKEPFLPGERHVHGLHLADRNGRADRNHRIFRAEGKVCLIIADGDGIFQIDILTA